MKRALLLPLLLAGCATAVPDSAPVTASPPAWYHPAGGAVPPSEWWTRRLEDPALARLVAAALAGSPDLAAAAARIDQARAGLRLTEAERMPLLSGSASVTYNRTSTGEFGFGGGGDGPAVAIDRERILTRAGIEGSWDADLFGRLAADEKAARARLSAAGFDAAAVRLALVTDVARNYVAGRAAAAREAIARDNVAAAEATLAVTREKARAGLVAGIDTVRGEALLAEAAATIAPIEAEQAARIAALTTLTGLPAAEVAPLVAPPDVPRFGAPQAGIPSDLLLRRPDIAAALARIAAADADTAAAVAGRYPRLSITAVLGLVAAALGDFFSADAIGATVGPSLPGPLLDFVYNCSCAGAARARTAEAVATYRGVVLRAFGEVEASLAAVDARERQRVALVRQVEAARETAQIARLQYRAGLTDFLGALEAERALNRARDRLAAVEAEAADAEIVLFRAIGGDFGAAPQP
ncbi:MAG: efflux transporter outer membrane subunit [Allosphingosinicella sp.]